MKSLFSVLLRLIGACSILYSLYVIISWYSLWISFYFIGDLQPSIIIGLLTFFLSPIAAIADLFWHSFQRTTIDALIYFVVFFIVGRILFSIGYNLRRKY